MSSDSEAILKWIDDDAPGFFEWLAARPWYSKIHLDWLNAVGMRADDSALEVGCGPGILTRYLHDQGVKMTGLDRSSAMVEKAKQHVPEGVFVEGDALSLPISDNEMDFAIAASVVNVVSEPGQLISEMARVVRPGGSVAVLFPTPRLEGEATIIAQRLALDGLSAAALEIWGSKAPKLEPSLVEGIFQDAGLQDLRLDFFFDETIASVAGKVSAPAKVK